MMSLPWTVTPLKFSPEMYGPWYLSPPRKYGLEYDVPGPVGKLVASNERLMPNATCSAVTGEPSSHLMPSFRVKVHVLKSSLGRPRSVARSGTRMYSPVVASRRKVVSERKRRSWAIALSVTDHRPAGSRLVGPSSGSGVLMVMVPPVCAPSTSGAGPTAVASLPVPPAAPSLKLAFPLGPSSPPPPQAASVNRAAPATAATTALLRLIDCPAFLSVFVAGAHRPARRLWRRVSAWSWDRRRRGSSRPTG